jgi:basic amino acid/polyamine antiporter, APA family
VIRRSIGSPALYALVYASTASAIYFSLGVVAEHALGLTPVVYLAAGVFFGMTTMTYVEGASLHTEARGGSTIFARYAFNELVSFIAGWAMLLDYVILVAITALTATNYLAGFWAPLGRGTLEVVIAIGLVAWAAVVNVRGVSVAFLDRRGALAFFDLGLQLLVIVLGLLLLFDGQALLDVLGGEGGTPSASELAYGFTIASVAFVGLEAASGLAGEIKVSRRGLRQLVTAGSVTTGLTFLGMATIAIVALPPVAGSTPLGERYVDAPVIGIVDQFDQAWLADGMRALVGGLAAATLFAACIGAMLGLSRLGFALATNRQIPSLVGRLHPERGTPYVLIGLAALLAAGLVIPGDLGFLLGIYAFGAFLAFTIAHASVTMLRYRDPDRFRPYAMPFSVKLGRGRLPLPAVTGAVIAALSWLTIVLQHEGARYVGLTWMAFGIALYVIYRTTESKPLLKRVTVPESALRAERAPEVEYGSILVPIFGRELDDDIMQTAGRLAGDPDDEGGEGGAVIEALWVFEIPISLPLDAPIPEAQLKRASEALGHAKRVGEEYEGVEVATAKVRARRTGQAIVEEARRRGVEAIVLAAEEPSRIRGGPVLGGRGAPLDNYVGDITKYVVERAPCRIILTAPPGPGAEGRERLRHPGPVT